MSPVRFQGGGGAAAGDTDQTADIGTLDGSLSHVGMVLDPQEVGQAADSLTVDTFSVILPLGTDTALLTPSNSVGTLQRSLGTHAVSALFQALGTFSQVPVGGHSHSGFSVDSVANAQQHGNSADQVRGTDWENVSNANGKDSGTVARIEAQNTTLAGDSYASSLRLFGFGNPSEPVGWTRDAVNLKVHQRWKTTINALDVTSTLTHTLRIRNASTILATLQTWDRNSADNTTLHTDTYAVSDANFAAMNRVRFNADCNLGIGTVVTSLVYWEVAWAAIELTYTRNDIT